MRLKTAEKIKDVSIIPFQVGHFDLYDGDIFERVVEMQAGFLTEVLGK